MDFGHKEIAHFSVGLYKTQAHATLITKENVNSRKPQRQTQLYMS